MLGLGKDANSNKEIADSDKAKTPFGIAKMTDREKRLCDLAYEEGRTSDSAVLAKEHNRREREREWRNKEHLELAREQHKTYIRDIKSSALYKDHCYFINNLTVVLQCVIAVGIIAVAIGVFLS